MSGAPLRRHSGQGAILCAAARTPAGGDYCSCPSLQSARHLLSLVPRIEPFIRLLTIDADAHYTNRMHPLESIMLVFLAAFLWMVFVVLMLARVNRARRRALRQERKANRIWARTRGRTDITARTGRARLHHLKVRKRT